MYFKDFPKLNYTFQNGKTIQVADVFRKVSFSQTLLNNDSAFLSSLLSQGESPEQIATLVYGDPNLSWLLFLSNNLINPHSDWGTEHSQVLEIIKANYTGNSYFILNLPALLENDIAVYCNGDGENWDFSKYTVIHDWNRQFRYFRGGGGNGSLIQGDYVIFFRRNTETDDFELISPIVSVIQKKVEFYNTITQFDNDVSIINPYNIVNDGSLTTYYASSTSTSTSIGIPDYTDSSTIRNTMIYKYMTGLSFPGSVTTILDQQLKQNYKKQHVNILKPEFKPSAIELFKRALDAKYIGRSIQITLTI